MKSVSILGWLERTKPLTTVTSGPDPPIHRLLGRFSEAKGWVEPQECPAINLYSG